MFDNETNNSSSINFDNLDHFYDENAFRLPMYQIKEDVPIVPWLKKEKANEAIKKKYKDEKCSICLEEISGDISITKCNHIFHYTCLCQYINNCGKTDCPICRSDLKKDKKNEVNNNNIIQQNNRNFFNRINQFDSFIENKENRNNRINQRNYDFNSNNNYNSNNNIRFNQQRNGNEEKGVSLVIIILVLIFIIKIINEIINYLKF